MQGQDKMSLTRKQIELRLQSTPNMCEAESQHLACESFGIEARRKQQSVNLYQNAVIARSNINFPPMTEVEKAAILGPRMLNA